AFLVRNEVCGEEWTVWDWDVWKTPGSMVFFLVCGLCAREVDRDGCSCPDYARAVSESGYCEHTACVEAVRRFLAREAEKRDVPAEERRARCAKEIEEAFR